MCVCVCVREREGGEVDVYKERERERERESTGGHLCCGVFFGHSVVFTIYFGMHSQNFILEDMITWVHLLHWVREKEEMGREMIERGNSKGNDRKRK